MCTRDTPPEACSAGRISLALIGRRASVGGSVAHVDCSRVIGVVDMSPGRKLSPLNKCPLYISIRYGKLHCI